MRGKEDDALVFLLYRILYLLLAFYPDAFPDIGLVELREFKEFYIRLLNVLYFPSISVSGLPTLLAIFLVLKNIAA